MSSLVEDINIRIREAYDILSPVIHHTPLMPSKTLSDMTQGEVLLKLENFQKTGAFKVRGAYYKLSKLKQKEGVSRVVAASSGNHAQGVAYSASQLGIAATIFMPRYTPFYKVNATKSYGAQVILHGETYDESYRKALEFANAQKMPFIHPFEDPDIIAGQGTIGVEIFKDAHRVDVVVVPVGGGGLISGIAVALKKLNDKIKIIGVQPSGAPAMYLSYKQGKLVETPNVFSIADGVIVKKPGELTLKIMEEVVDDMVLVDDKDTARAVFVLLERAKTVAEPAGALSVAALLSGAIDVKGKRAVAVVSGGNVEPSLLSRIITQTLFVEGRQVKIRGMLPDRPGQLKRVIDVVADLGLNIISIEHERVNPLVAPGLAEVTLGIEVPSREVINLLIVRLKEQGLSFEVV
ncbi:threonine dehydratase [Infirmifilum uzonense]|uniref:threonine ammonia-lyase n=1 Tax=Infirmifilum uzonense TaxID=1550241 RepID=A0A0F7FKB1_9CREN|nr:threonine ammonia-lyase [Infirmifilum uzonense]AKG39413.1 threonine dehydratase [Infirmifilum uzonense]